MENKKQFIKESLEYLKKQSELIDKALDLNINLVNFEFGSNYLITALSHIVNTNKVEILDDWISWWLYENVDKMVTTEDGKENDLNNLDNFIDWVFVEYGN